MLDLLLLFLYWCLEGMVVHGIGSGICGRWSLVAIWSKGAQDLDSGALHATAGKASIRYSVIIPNLLYFYLRTWHAGRGG
jgi:hypothetical protein